MKRLKYLFEYTFVRLLDLFLSLPPRSMALALGERIGFLLSWLLPKRRKLIFENLAHAFPEKTAAEKKWIADRVWRNLGRTAVEFIRVPPLLRTDLEHLVIWEGVEHVEKALRGQTGVILLTAHFCNWELTGIFSQLQFRNVMAIARPMGNPLVENWLRAKRAFSGMRIILHREAVRASLKWLKDKNMIGILIDQNLYTGGAFVDFFGRPAATTTLPALLHVRTGAPVITTYTMREGEKFRMIYERPVVFPKVQNEENRVLCYTQVITKRLENVIRKYPENWFWIHNRWKRQPE